MKTQRREFLFGAAAFVSCFGLAARAGERKLRFGVMSDIHIAVDVNGKPGWTYRRFVRALEWMKTQDVDAVMIAGDLTEHGLDTEMALVSKTWFSVFPEDRGLNGKKVVRLITSGNHEFDGWRYGHRGETDVEAKYWHRSMAKDPAGYWERYWHEPYADIFTKEVNGYTFVLSHYNRWQGLRTHLQQLNPNPHRPFFYCQHVHPKGTVCWEGCSDDGGVATEALSNFPNAIAFSGHTHEPANDPRSIWQGTFTSIGTGAVSQLFLQRGRENYLLDKGDKRDPELPRMKLSDGTNVLLVDVYDDRLVLSYRSALSGFEDTICEDRVVRLPACTSDEARPWQFSSRKAAAQPPQFAAGTFVSVEQPSYPGKTRKGKPSRQIVVSFLPAARLCADGGLKDYEIAAEVRMSDGRVSLGPVRRLYALGHYLPEAKAQSLIKRKGRGVERCPFARDLFPDGTEFRFRVTPFDAWDNPGRSIVSEWVRG